MNWDIDIAGKCWRHGDYSLIRSTAKAARWAEAETTWQLMHTEGRVCSIVAEMLETGTGTLETGRTWAEGLMR